MILLSFSRSLCVFLFSTSVFAFFMLVGFLLVGVGFCRVFDSRRGFGVHRFFSSAIFSVVVGGFRRRLLAVGSLPFGVVGFVIVNDSAIRLLWMLNRS